MRLRWHYAYTMSSGNLEDRALCGQGGPTNRTNVPADVTCYRCIVRLRRRGIGA